MRVEDDDGDFAVAQDAQFVGLLHQTELTLRERNLGENKKILPSQYMYSLKKTKKLQLENVKKSLKID